MKGNKNRFKNILDESVEKINIEYKKEAKTSMIKCLNLLFMLFDQACPLKISHDCLIPNLFSIDIF
ncbi:hypothetical protein BUY49_00290 [Staphylococcus devriesei]|nr:hypothetical protein BUY49_00290 [Staphylococcus devriesei]